MYRMSQLGRIWDKCAFYLQTIFLVGFLPMTAILTLLSFGFCRRTKGHLPWFALSIMKCQLTVICTQKSCRTLNWLYLREAAKKVFFAASLEFNTVVLFRQIFFLELLKMVTLHRCYLDLYRREGGGNAPRPGGGGEYSALRAQLLSSKVCLPPEWWKILSTSH